MNGIRTRFAGVEINAYVDYTIYQTLLAIYMRREAQGIDCSPPPPHNNWLYYVDRGLFHFSIRNYGEAILDFTQAINLNPDYAQAYYERGRAYAKKRNVEKSIEDWKRAIELDPKLGSLIDQTQLG